jgi:hypothetical protein
VVFLLLGRAVAYGGVRFDGHVGAARDTQQAIAFLCIAGTLLFLSITSASDPKTQ